MSPCRDEGSWRFAIRTLVRVVIMLACVAGVGALLLWYHREHGLGG